MYIIFLFNFRFLSGITKLNHLLMDHIIILRYSVWCTNDICSRVLTETNANDLYCDHTALDSDDENVNSYSKSSIIPHTVFILKIIFKYFLYLCHTSNGIWSKVWASRLYLMAFLWWIVMFIYCRLVDRYKHIKHMNYKYNFFSILLSSEFETKMTKNQKKKSNY